MITRDDTWAKCFLHELPLSPGTISIWSKCDHILTTTELAHHDKMGFIAIYSAALVEEVEDGFGGVEEHERLRKNAYMGNVSICARPFEGDEPEFGGCKIKYVAYDRKRLWSRWEGGTGGLVGGVPTRKQREGDEGHREEHRYFKHDHRRVVLVNPRIYHF